MKFKDTLFISMIIFANIDTHASYYNPNYNRGESSIYSTRQFRRNIISLQGLCIRPSLASDDTIKYLKANGQFDSCKRDLLKLRIQSEYKQLNQQQKNLYIKQLQQAGYLEIPPVVAPLNSIEKTTHEVITSSLAELNDACDIENKNQLLNNPSQVIAAHKYIGKINSSEQPINTFGPIQKPKIKVRPRGPEYSIDEKNNIQLEYHREKINLYLYKQEADKVNASLSEYIQSFSDNR